MASKEFQIKAPGCGCCCGPCRDESPFGHADRIRWYQYAFPISSLYQIDNYLVKGTGSEFFARNYEFRRPCNVHTWVPEACQYQIRPEGNPTLSCYQPYYKVNAGPRMYEQKWTFDAVQKSWVPLKADGTAWPQNDPNFGQSASNEDPLWFGQYPALGYRLGSPGLQLTFESVRVSRPTTAALSSPVSLTDSATTGDALLLSDGWQAVTSGSTDITYNMAAEGVVETSEGPYGPASSWDRSCVRCPKMYRITQKLIQHIVSADGLYDYEEILYPVAEYPWSPLHNNARAFSWSRYPGKTLFNSSEVVLPERTLGGTIPQTPSYDVRDTGWNNYFFLGYGALGQFYATPADVPIYPAPNASHGKIGSPYFWNPERGPSSPSAAGDFGSHLIHDPATGIQFSLDQRWRRHIGDTYGAWSSPSILQPPTDPPVQIRGGYSYPNYVGLGSVHPEYPVPTGPLQTLSPLSGSSTSIWQRSYLGEDSPPNILTTLGKNRWTTINPVVYFFRDYLWIDGKYRLCDITITEGNDDYQWTAPAGNTTLSIQYAGFPAAISGPGVFNNVSHVRWPIFQLEGTGGTIGTYTIGGEEGTGVWDGPPNGYSSYTYAVPPATSFNVPNGEYIITCTQLPAYKLTGDAGWTDHLVTGPWPRNFAAWGADMTYLFTFCTTVFGGALSSGGAFLVEGFGSAGLPDENSYVYFLGQHPNNFYRIEQPDYVPFTGIRGGVRNGLNVKMVGATVEIYGGTTFTPPASMTLLATTTTDADGAWEVNVTPDSFYVVVNGSLYEQASGSPGDFTYYGTINTRTFFTYPIDPPVYEFNFDVHLYTTRA